MDRETMNAIKAKVTLLGLKIFGYHSEACVLEKTIDASIKDAAEGGASAIELSKIKGDIERCKTLASVCDELRPIYAEIWELLNKLGDS